MEKENAFADVEIEGAKETDAFLNGNKESTPAESQPAKVEEESKPASGELSTGHKEEEPFHKRWESHSKNLKEELEAKHQAELQTLREEFETKYSPKEEPNADIPKWFSKVYGNDPELWSDYQEHEVSLVEKAKQEIVNEQENSKKEEQYWNQWVDDQVTVLQNAGHSFDRNELLKAVMDYRPTDAEGNLDFNAALKILEIQKTKESDPVKLVARKQFADGATRSTNKGESVKKDYVSSVDIRKKNWSDL
jgi:hypothetical protein